MKSIRRFLVAMGLGVMLSATAHAQAQGTIKVGAIFPLSGGAGPQGQHVAQAIQAMAAMINEARRRARPPDRDPTRDDESTPGGRRRRAPTS